MEPRLIQEGALPEDCRAAFEAHVQRALLLALLAQQRITRAQYEDCVRRLRGRDPGEEGGEG